MELILVDHGERLSLTEGVDIYTTINMCEIKRIKNERNGSWIVCTCHLNTLIAAYVLGGFMR